jgi:hypothetical protein
MTMTKQEQRRDDRKTPRRIGRWIELSFGLLLIVFLLLGPATTVVQVWLMVVIDGLKAFFLLLPVDGAATAWSLALWLARMVLAALPFVSLIRCAPRHRWAWLIPSFALLLFLTSPFAAAACASIDRWLLLAALSGVAAVLSRRRFLGWTVLLPFAVLWEIVPRHGVLEFADVGTRDPAYREQLLGECARREGTRPRNLTADHLMPYHGISALGDDLVLLTGEGPNDGGMRGDKSGRRIGSWWLRRVDGVFEIEQPSEAVGNLWRGCILNGTIWMARTNHVIGAKRLPPGSAKHEEVYRIRLPTQEIDFAETACDPERERVYVTEGPSAGMWELRPDGSDSRRHDIGGLVLLPKRRFDGRIVISSTAFLRVFVPAEGRLREPVASGMFTIGNDICAADGSMALADASGRLRVFTMDGPDRYRFAWGISLFAPRRVAYSPDCTRLAVTSADDHRVYLIDTTERRILDVFQAGPALREVAATGPREFSITDVCSMTTYRW